MRENSEDLFASTRMSFGDHIEELRTHLWRALIGFFIAMVASFAVGRPVERFIVHPVESQLMQLYDERAQRAYDKIQDDPALAEENEPKPVRMIFNRRELAEGLGIKLPPGAEGQGETFPATVGVPPVIIATTIDKAERLTVRPPSLVALSVTEGFMVFMKVCIYCGLVLSSPWIFYQIWAFVAAGLYPHEKRYVHLYLPISIGLFLAGVALCEFVVIPKAVRWLLEFNQWLGLEPDLRLNEWLSFAILMPLIFGIAFQTPLVMLFLERLGIMTIDSYRAYRRYAFFALALVAAVIAPSPDILSIMALTVALWVLYELGVVLCRYAPRPPGLDVDVPEPEEMVEV